MSCKVDGRILSESRVRENLTHGLTRGVCGDIVYILNQRPTLRAHC